MNSGTPPSVGIVAGEPSGDALGATLIHDLRNLFPGCRFVGIGGPRMHDAGCEILFEMGSIGMMGLDQLFSRGIDILRIRKRLGRRFIADPPDIFVGIDVPDFNLSLESRLKKRGIPTVHYVSPTVWAWRGYRICKIRRAVTCMLTLFPFETEYYRHKNVPVSYVGHPIADEISQPDREGARQQLGLDAGMGQTLIALLPGSRKSEIDYHARLFAESARLMSTENPEFRFVLPFADTTVRQRFVDLVGDLDDLPVRMSTGNARQVLDACDVALLASGTAALEATLLERPHVVTYRVSTITWWLFRILRHVEYYSMPNHLLSRPCIPELMQKDATPRKVSDAVCRLIADRRQMKALETEFRKIRQQLKVGADMRAARVIARIMKTEHC